MKIHLVKKSTIEDFVSHHADSRSALKFWQLVINGTEWNSLGDILGTFNYADLLDSRSHKVVFNIGGDSYRMIGHYVFRGKEVHLFICWIGALAEYTKLCNDNKQYAVGDSKKHTIEILPYKVIKTRKQYFDYCNLLEALVVLKAKSKEQKDAIELLTLLIEKWDEAHNTFTDADPIEILRYLMEENKLNSAYMTEILEISKSLFSDIINYRRGLSKEVIRKLSEWFKVSQELFNKPYKLLSPLN